MNERTAILDTLYAEVIGASRLADSTKTGSPEAHRAALAALQKAVERYTDYSLDGHVPEDLNIESEPAHSLSQEERG